MRPFARGFDVNRQCDEFFRSVTSSFTTHLCSHARPLPGANSGGSMKKIGNLMLICVLALSVNAFAQSTSDPNQDGMKHDEMKQDTMKPDNTKKDTMGHDDMKKDDMAKSKKSKKLKKDKMKQDNMSKDNMKQDDMKKDDMSKDDTKKN
jgi:pentapeptide MXKDX repeat protein